MSNLPLIVARNVARQKYKKKCLKKKTKDRDSSSAVSFAHPFPSRQLGEFWQRKINPPKNHKSQSSQDHRRYECSCQKV